MRQIQSHDFSRLTCLVINVQHRATDSYRAGGMLGAKNVTSKKKEIQNAPNELNATAPNVFPVRNSHIPASN